VHIDAEHSIFRDVQRTALFTGSVIFTDKSYASFHRGKKPRGLQ
jgi:hypothetical protein